VTFDSPFEQDAKSVVVSVKPIQDLHGYDHPWPAGGGKNKCPYDTVSFTSGSTWCNLTGGAASSLLQGSQVALKAGTYYISMPTNTNIDGMQVADSGENVLVNSKNGSFTLATDETIYIRVKQEVASQPTTCKIQIEAGSSATSWEPYSNICPISGTNEVEIEVSDGESEPTTTTIPLPSTLYDADVDVTEGSADSRFGFAVFDGSNDEPWEIEGAPTFASGSKRFLYVGAISAPQTVATEIPNMISNGLQVTSGEDSWNIVDNAVSVSVSGLNLSIRVAGIDTVEGLKMWLSNNPVQVCYELATHTTISFDPTDVELLEGTNVVSANTGDISMTVKYDRLADLEDRVTALENA
jgi:hypothetical protein